jgi:hypothetical protein
MIEVGLYSIGVVAEGLPGWEKTASILRQEIPYTWSELPSLKPIMLQPNERRRTTRTIKIALQAAEEAMQTWDACDSLQSVFSSSEGDLDIIDQICQSLALPDRPVSPTQFHNSVHNAPAGYWSMGSGSQAASTSLAGLEGSFASALVEASVQVVSENRPILMVCYDQPPPPLLKDFIPIQAPFSVALLLTPKTSEFLTIARLQLQPSATERQLSQMKQPVLEQLRLAAPAAKSLPLLDALAIGESSYQKCLPYLPGLNLIVDILE